MGAPDLVGWAEADGRVVLEDGFAVVPCSPEPGGPASPAMGWNLYAPGGGGPFAWAGSPVEIAEKVARERRERLFSRAPDHRGPIRG